MATPQELAQRLLFDSNPINPTPVSFAPAQGQRQQQHPMQAQPVPLPQANPFAAAASVPPGTPLSLAPPLPPNNFSGDQGPQWSDQQWQNYWDRSQGLS